VLNLWRLYRREPQARYNKPSAIADLTITILRHTTAMACGLENINPWSPSKRHWLRSSQPRGPARHPRMQASGHGGLARGSWQRACCRSALV